MVVDKNSGGAKRRVRKIDGIVLLDKPTGWTSNRALQKVKRIFSAAKAGHTGSLDPLATGLLPICLGQATKVSAYLLDAGKHYQVVAKLGEKTATGDADGDVIESAGFDTLTEDGLGRAIAEFSGPIIQIPPMYSALKHKGKRLYELARKGVEVERQPREVTIYNCQLTAFDGQYMTLDIECSKGTYVRTLVEDIAGAAGTLAHVTQLRRTVVGPYVSEDMWTIDQLEALEAEGDDALDAVLKPIDSAVEDRPLLNLNQDTAYYLMQGQAVTAPGAPRSGQVRLYGDGSKFLGLGEITSDGRVAPKRLFIT